MDTVNKNDELLRVSVCDGKYTVIQEAAGRLKALRYGEEWRDCCGDTLIMALAQRVDELEHQISGLLAAAQSLEMDVYSLINSTDKD